MRANCQRPDRPPTIVPHELCIAATDGVSSTNWRDPSDYGNKTNEDVNAFIRLAAMSPSLQFVEDTPPVLLQ